MIYTRKLFCLLSLSIAFNLAGPYLRLSSNSLIALIVSIFKFRHIHMISMDALVCITRQNRRVLKYNVAHAMRKSQFLEETVNPQHRLAVFLALVKQCVKIFLNSGQHF